MVAALWASWLLYYSPPHDEELQFMLIFIMAFSPILTGPTLILVKYIWPKR